MALAQIAATEPVVGPIAAGRLWIIRVQISGDDLAELMTQSFVECWLVTRAYLRLSPRGNSGAPATYRAVRSAA
jgi:hypothetical protein